MKIGAMLGDVLRVFFRPPATERYPFERRAAPARLRGALRWNPEKCTGCGLCAKDCPANAIELITLDKARKRFVLRYHTDRCAFCGQCVQSCRFNCITLPPDEWELAAPTRAAFEQYFGDETDVDTILAGPPATDAHGAA